MVSAESVGGDVAESRRVLSGLKCYESATLQRIYIAATQKNRLPQMMEDCSIGNVELVTDKR